jgi:flagellin
MKNGDFVSFTVSLEDGTSYTAKYVVGNKSTTAQTANAGLYDTDGNWLKDLATASEVALADISNFIVSDLQKSGKFDDYNISVSSGVFTFEAKETGTDVSAVKSFDFNFSNSGTVQTPTAIGVTTSKTARDAGREIAASAITTYTGNNYDDAVFTINGHKFVVAASGQNNGTGTTDLKVTDGLGADVTILQGGSDALKNIAANKYWASNISKIAEVTGLTVTDAVAESTATGVGAGSGIRLSKGTSGAGLTLQIGDTAKSYNQLDVNVEDMHTSALGIKNIDISTQDGATAAIDVIKAAINKVSSTRGTLGAVQNRLEHTQNNLSVMTENIQDAESTIRDTDIAEEMMSYTKNNILVQSAQAMLAQANSVPQGVLQLLQ